MHPLLLHLRQAAPHRDTVRRQVDYNIYLLPPPPNLLPQFPLIQPSSYNSDYRSDWSDLHNWWVDNLHLIVRLLNNYHLWRSSLRPPTCKTLKFLIWNIKMIWSIYKVYLLSVVQCVVSQMWLTYYNLCTPLVTVVDSGGKDSKTAVN